MNSISSVNQIVELARAHKGKRIVVPSAETESALGAAIEARKSGLAQSVLIGDVEKLKKMLAEAGEDISHYEIIAETSDTEAARKAVALVRAGEAHVILKGKLKTGDLLRAVLHREEGLRTGSLLSDVLVSENPMSVVPKILCLTDGGMNVAPDFAAKRAIVENAVRVLNRIGFAKPKVAILCALEEPSDGMPHTIEARKLQELCENGEIKNCEICGPLALDNAIWPEAARIKGISHPVAGQADLLVVPTIETGNALGKAFTYFAKKPVGHVIEGAKAPILIPSRAESSQDKLISIALGILCAPENFR
jgi:phosphate butyryltransferase